MSRDENFYSPLSIETASQRLQSARVKGVKIHVQENDPHILHFRFDLLKSLPIGNLTNAHLKGTIQGIQGNRIRVDYHTRALFPHASLIIPAINIFISLILWTLLPIELAIISGLPLIMGVLFGIFWSFFRDSLNEGDRQRLQELLGRMLEKSTSMRSWQG